MDIAALSDNVVELKDIIYNLYSENHHTREQNEFLKEEIKSLRAFIYAHKSEKWRPEDKKQAYLFNEAEIGSTKETDVLEQITYTRRKKKKSGRKPLSDNLKRVEIIHDLPEAEKFSANGEPLKKISEDIKEELIYVPAKIYVNRHIYPNYVVPTASGSIDGEPEIKSAAKVPSIIERSFASACLLAYLFTSKFMDHLPFYRLERVFARLGVELSRATMCNWAIAISRKLMPLMVYMKRDILAGILIESDDTRMQVFKEKGRQNTDRSYMWLFKGKPPDSGGPVIYYKYHSSRSGDVPSRFIRRSFRGALMTDDYGGYNKVAKRPNIIAASCWAHARRKFKKAHDAAYSENTERALSLIAGLYNVEAEIRNNNYSLEKILKLRREKSLPIIQEFERFCQKLQTQVNPGSLIGQAVSYVMEKSTWKKLQAYINYPHIPIDNNMAENFIRPFVLGRKNWLFSGSTRGALASVILYTIIQTAVANGLNPYWYLRYLFEKIPTIKSRQEYKDLAPNRIAKEIIELYEKNVG